jgi:hypothetical protein
MCTSSNIHIKIQQNKRVLIHKLWEELARQMTYPICNIYLQIGAKFQQERSDWYEIFPQLRDAHIHQLYSKFKIDMYKTNEIIVENPERTDRHHVPFKGI